MIINSKYTKTFTSNDLTRLKYDELYQFAINIRNHRNTVFEYVNNNLRKYLDYNKFEFEKEMISIFGGTITSSFYHSEFRQIYAAYQNKFNAVKKNLKFETIHYLGVELYKRTTKKTHQRNVQIG